jgi:hypothetical protein
MTRAGETRDSSESADAGNRAGQVGQKDEGRLASARGEVSSDRRFLSLMLPARDTPNARVPLGIADSVLMSRVKREGGLTRSIFNLDI